MFKKHLELILAFTLSAVLAAGLALFLKHFNTLESDKSQLQLSLENSSSRWNDLFYRPNKNKKPSEDVIIVAVDDSSLIEVGRWPWSRNVINQIAQQLISYGVKTISFDIFFSEDENKAADENFVKTVTKTPEKLIFGTYSQTKHFVQPYQDYCLTQAFLYTGGDNLVKVNPFFVVIDEDNIYEELAFNTLFTPIFNQIDRESEADYLQRNKIADLNSLTLFQKNTLNYYKKQWVYDYCTDWLTESDGFDFRRNPALKDIYFSLFKVSKEAALEKAILEFKQKSLLIPIPQYTMWLQNITSLQKAAQYTASLVSHPDQDGTVRGYPLLLRTGNQLGTSYIPSLSLQAYLAATGYQSQFKIEKIGNKKRVAAVEIFDVDTNNTVTSVPVDEEGKLQINYYGKQNTIFYVSAKEFLNDSAEIEYSRANESGIVEKFTSSKKVFLKNKSAIIGATAVGIWDIKTTPNDINYPGPEIHATILSNLLNKDYLSFDINEAARAPWILFLFLLINSVVLIKTTARFGVFYFLATLALLVWYQNERFITGTMFHSSLAFFVLYIAAYLLTFIYKYFFQSRKSNEIKRAFSKYVSKDVVEEILKNEGAIELRGQKLHMSVFFSDIRGFTSFSENMDPVEVSELLNKYFTPMSAIITSHQGTIDKYIGDAIMAMFGAPVNYKDHAYQACLSALECTKQLDQINIEFTKRNWPKINAGIGVNSGYMNAGNIGSKTIQNYTVIGDSVNLASRVQGLNKDYGTQILITEFTYELVKDRFECREIDKVAIRGRTEGIRIYELIDLKQPKS